MSAYEVDLLPRRPKRRLVRVTALPIRDVHENGNDWEPTGPMGCANGSAECTMGMVMGIKTCECE